MYYNFIARACIIIIIRACIIIIAHAIILNIIHVSMILVAHVRMIIMMHACFYTAIALMFDEIEGAGSGARSPSAE